MTRRTWVAVEPLVLLCVMVSASWLIYLYAVPVSPWVRAHWDDLNTALFLYLPLIPMFALRGKYEAGVDTYGVEPGQVGRGLKVALATGAVLAPLFALAFWAASRFGPEWFRPAFEPHVPKNFGMVALFQFVQVALPEEFFFRGYAQGRLDQVFPGRVRILGAEVGWGLVWANALFALAHPLLAGPHVLASWSRLETFVPGLLFGWLRARGGGVAAPVLVHWGSNLLLFALAKGG